MIAQASIEELYVTSLREIFAGIVLVAVTIAMHGFGVVATLRTSNWIKERVEARVSFALGVGVIILAAWMLIVVHLAELVVWAWYFKVYCGFKTFSLAYYVAMMDYTTLGCDFDLPASWRLLEGIISISGLISFAWSTGVLLTLAEGFQSRQLEALRAKRASKRGAAPSPGAQSTS